MGQVARWVTAAVAAAVAFVVGAGFYQAFLHFSWLPHAESDQWVVAAGFGAAFAAIVGAGLGTWAARAGSEAREPSTHVEQRARASGHGRINQVGGDQHNTGKQPDA